MIIKGSAAKGHRQSEKRRLHNKVVRSRVRTGAKKVLQALEAGQKDAAAEAYRSFAALIDSAAGKGVYHANTAARKKSRMAKKVHALA